MAGVLIYMKDQTRLRDHETKSQNKVKKVSKTLKFL